jgi:hypothetical protein
VGLADRRDRRAADFGRFIVANHFPEANVDREYERERQAVLHVAQLPGWPHHQIDRLLVRCRRVGTTSLRVDACERVHASPRDDVWASDHFGLVADLSVLPPRPAT